MAQKQRLLICKLNEHTISGVHVFGCKVYPPRDATDAGAPERDGGQLAADSICVAGACAGTPGENPRTPLTTNKNTCRVATTRVLQKPPAPVSHEEDLQQVPRE